ncbi:hypothetical protein Clacol_002607 [Clathrus columnatus]|uniref:FAS1-like dehydratase domain-containing protein n=1 Tax=Clathrus columnatus TaxID=1419009 RepID=A0AAV5A442_9AGAM|nr:hypothetical protein Clacol_002607 [Clathrus columnatus]
MRVFAQVCKSSLSSSSSLKPKSLLFRSQESEQAIRKWLISKEGPHFSLQTLHISRLNDLFAILPTRSHEYRFMKMKPSPPILGSFISLSCYFGLFPDLYRVAPLKIDGSTAWHTPPYPFTRKLPHSGRVVVSLKSPPIVGMNFIKKGIHLESKEARSYSPKHSSILHTRRKIHLYQWFPVRTDLLNEDCVTAFYPDKYDGKPNQFDGLPGSSEGFLSYSFMPTRWRIRDFAMFSQDTHKIYYDPDYAKLEGYPDLVVQPSLQVTVMLDVLLAYMHQGFMCNALEYRVINPLFCNREIRVFRYPYSGTNQPLCLDDLTPDPTALIELEGSLKDKSTTRQEIKRSILPRRSGLKGRVLIWTEDENGTVGTVVFATLIKRTSPVWQLDSRTGYILPVGSTWPPEEKRNNNHPTGQRPLEDDTRNPDQEIVEEPVTFDSLGRPILRHISQPLRAWPSRHPWQQNDDDIAALDSERDARKQYAARLEESRNLLKQLARKEGNNFSDLD